MVSCRRAVAAPMRYFDEGTSSEAQGACPPLARSLLGKSATLITVVAQQALCNALGASGLHWVWAIDATSGPRLSFQDGRVAPISYPGESPSARDLT